MVLKLYSGTLVASATGVVALVLMEKHIPFEYIPIAQAAKEHKTPEFLAMQPFGQIPVIDDDGFILYESRAISRYLAEKYAHQGTLLLPLALKERALVEQAASVELAHFHPIVEKVFHGAASRTASRSEGVGELYAKLDVYEAILGKQKFLAGDESTLVDLLHLSLAPFLASTGLDIMTSKGPNVTRWWNEVISQPA